MLFANVLNNILSDNNVYVSSLRNFSSCSAPCSDVVADALELIVASISKVQGTSRIGSCNIFE